MISQVCFAQFNQQVLEKSFQQLVILDISAEWCAPCKSIMPTLSKVTEEFQDKFLLAKLDVDEGDNMKIAGSYHAKGFPTLIAFSSGQEIDRFHGNQSLQFIRDFIQRNLSNN